MSRGWVTLAALAIVATVAVLTPSPGLAANIRIWDGGGADTNWTNPDNWVGDIAPAAGDFLTFPANPAQLTAHNDFPPGTTFAVIFFGGSGYTLTGSSIGLSNLMTATNTSGTNTVSLFAITLTANQTWDTTAGGTLVVNSGVLLNGKTLSFDGEGTLAIDGAIQPGGGSTGLNKAGAGTVVLSGGNTFTGPTAVNAGTLKVTTSSALGSAAAGTTVQNGATLEVSGSIGVGDPLILNGSGVGGVGALRSTGGTSVATGSVTLASAATVGVSAGQLTVSGAIGGPGGLTKVGAGTLVFAGATPNSYLGTTAVNAGTLLLAKTVGVAAIPGAVTIGDGVNLSVLKLTNGSQMADTSALTMTAPASFDLNGNAEMIGSLAGTGGVHLSSASSTGTLTVGVNNLSTVFDGFIEDSVMPGGILNKIGAGTLTLSGNSTYQGQTLVQAGTLKITSATALGSPAAGTTVQNGASLEVAGAISVGEPLTLNGGGAGAAGALQSIDGVDKTWSGAITLASTATVGVSGAGPLTVSGAMGGPGGLTKVGAGTLRWTGVANTYAGTTAVNTGTLQVGKSMAIPGNVTIGDGASTATLLLLTSNQIADTGGVTVNSPGVFDLHGLSETIGSLAGTGLVTTLPAVNSVSTLTVGVDNTSTTFGGAIQDKGVGMAVLALTKVGAGTLTLTGTNTYVGNTNVQAGTLRVDGSLPNTTSVFLAGGTLAGSGTVRNILASGPAGAGAVSPGSSPGTLSSTGPVDLNVNTSFVVELNGASPGSGYDQLVVASSVSLGGSTLNASLGFVPAAGATFIIIRIDGGAFGASGTFNGLPQGASLTISGQPFQINYHGGDGNDVVLTFLQLIPCSPRPPVSVQVHPNGDGQGHLLATLTPSQNISVTPNLVQSLQFTQLDNAAITINGSPVQVNVPVPISPPQSSFQFIVRRPTPGEATTARLNVQDNCQGAWPTFVGAGVNVAVSP